MIIAAGTVGMAAKSTKKVTYQQKNQTIMSNPTTGEKRLSETEFTTTYQRTLSGEMQGADYSLPKQNYIASVQTVGKRDSIQDLISQMRNFLLEFRNRLTLMIGRTPTGGRYYGDGSYMPNSTNSVLDLSSGTGQVNVWNVTRYDSVTYKEEESMVFETVGKVLTADGRSIDFNMQLEMSREFQETTECLTKETEVIMTDPLVINLGTNPIGVSDQKWKFDIDGDGKEDNISMLSKGSGFLAYDKNGDRKINNGLELFGAKSGNGFLDLMEYDEDGNGWIDEKDSIYSKLSVWVKDDAGTDKMLSLKEANVGAIYLANQRTEFSLMADDEKKQNAQIRRTGLFLTEEGMAKSIQQLDMVSALVS